MDHLMAEKITKIKKIGKSQKIFKKMQKAIKMGKFLLHGFL